MKPKLSNYQVNLIKLLSRLHDHQFVPYVNVGELKDLLEKLKGNRRPS